MLLHDCKQDDRTLTQTDCPLFSKLPFEIRIQIFEHALRAYDDESRPFNGHYTFIRHGYRYSQIQSTTLLRTCRRIYLETYLLPITLNELVSWSQRGPPNSLQDPRDLLHVFNAEQRAAVHCLHLFTKQSWLESDCWQTLLQSQDINPKRIHITMMHNDWSPCSASTMRLELDPKRKGSVRGFLHEPWGDAFKYLYGLREFTLEIESVGYEQADLEEIIHRSQTWQFPLADGNMLSLDESKTKNIYCVDAANPVEHQHSVTSNRFRCSCTPRLGQPPTSLAPRNYSLLPSNTFINKWRPSEQYAQRPLGSAIPRPGISFTLQQPSVAYPCVPIRSPEQQSLACYTQKAPQSTMQAPHKQTSQLEVLRAGQQRQVHMHVDLQANNGVPRQGQAQQSDFETSFQIPDYINSQRRISNPAGSRVTLQPSRPQPVMHPFDPKAHGAQWMLCEQKNRKRVLTIAKMEQDLQPIAQKQKKRKRSKVGKEMQETRNMCTSPGLLPKRPERSTENHRLQDYQMQLMILEQQNLKRRLTEAQRLEVQSRERYRYITILTWTAQPLVRKEPYLA